MSILGSIRIIVADDHAVVRRGIREILHEGLEDPVILEAQNADEAIALVRTGVWDLLILDITMPGRSGLDVLQDVRACRPQLPILVVTMHPEGQLALRALRAGASGYLTKSSAPDELVTAVRKVIAGGKYVSDALTAKLVDNLQGNGGQPSHELLSNREYEVMHLIASGKTLSQIAQTLSLSVKTVSTYRRRILDKMEMQTNAELTRYAVGNSLLE